MKNTVFDRRAYIDECWEKARQYGEGVENGSIICNENIRLAVKRHVEDLKRPDLDYRIDKVEKVFKFFSYLYVKSDTHFNLTKWQAFVLVALFGLYYKDSEVRKYLYAFLFIGRKNGKTTFIAALQLYFMMADGAAMPESLLVLDAVEQTEDTAFKTLANLIYHSPAIRDRLTVFKSLKVEFRPDSNGIQKPGMIKVKTGIPNKNEGLNPTSCILDELHTWRDSQKFNVFKNALGTKANPMLFLISTAGYGKDSFCAQMVEAGRNVLRGISEDDRFFYMLYELEAGDDPSDSKNWYKANPSIGEIEHFEMQLFKDQFKTNKNIPSLYDDFLTKKCNIFLEEQSEWIPTDVIISNVAHFDEETVKDLPCYIGLDLSEINDLTSIVLLWDGGDRLYVKPYFYFVNGPKGALRRGNIDIRQWIREQHIINAEKDGYIDKKLIKDTLFEFHKKYKVRGLYYDPWHFRIMMDTRPGSKGEVLISDDGKENIFCTPCAAGIKRFDWPIRFAEGIIYRKRITFYPNKCLLWNFRNLIIDRDKWGNKTPDKKKSKDSTDGVISFLNALYGYLGGNASAATKFLREIKPDTAEKL